MTVIHWFRRDLRLQDNIALHHAIDSGQAVIPVFIFDDRLLTSPRVRLLGWALSMQFSKLRCMHHQYYPQ